MRFGLTVENCIGLRLRPLNGDVVWNDILLLGYDEFTDLSLSNLDNPRDDNLDVPDDPDVLDVFNAGLRALVPDPSPLIEDGKPLNLVTLVGAPPSAPSLDTLTVTFDIF